MKALNLYGIGDLRYEDVAMPEPAADEVLLKVLAVGICGSDIPRVFVSGVKRYPMITGHEFAGEIVAVGEEADPRLSGKRAAVFPLLPCSKCTACMGDNFASCKEYDYYGSRRDGAFAEYIAVKEWNLMLLPDNVPIEIAAMMEPLSVAIHAIEKANLIHGETVCIFGAGAIGIILAKFATLRGAANVILFDIDDAKLDFARRQGFPYAFNNRDEGCFDEALALIGRGEGVDISIDAAGVPAAVAGCLKVTRAAGTVVLMGNPSGDMMLKQDDYWSILRKQLTLKGTWNSDFGDDCNQADWDKALMYLSSGKLDLSGLITHTFALKDAGAAFKMMNDHNEFYVKVMILPHEKEL